MVVHDVVVTNASGVLRVKRPSPVVSSLRSSTTGNHRARRRRARQKQRYSTLAIHLGHSHAKIAPVMRPKMTPSMRFMAMARRFCWNQRSPGKLAKQ